MIESGYLQIVWAILLTLLAIALILNSFWVHVANFSNIACNSHLSCKKTTKHRTHICTCLNSHCDEVIP